MNLFDLAVTIGLLFAVVTGFTTGLLRSALTILAYLVAMPLAVAALGDDRAAHRERCRPRRFRPTACCCSACSS